MRILCRVMKVSKSASYAWCARPGQLIIERELSIYRQAKALFKASRNSLGSRELSKRLHETSYKVANNLLNQNFNPLASDEIWDGKQKNTWPLT